MGKSVLLALGFSLMFVLVFFEVVSAAECTGLSLGGPGLPLPDGTPCGNGGFCSGGICIVFNFNFSFPSPTCSDDIQNQGELDVDCGGPCPACVVAPYCGDGNVDAGEECDGNNLGGSTCDTIPGIVPYIGGTLSCNGPGVENSCMLDVSECISEPESKVYWADMSGNEITEADLGDTVKLIAEGVDSGTFSIWEKDIGFDDYIRDVVGSEKDANLVGTWTIEREDLSELFGESEFYFEIKGMQSGNLKINPDEDDTDMNVSIKGVDCGIYFDEGIVRNITITADDPDDELIGNVTIYGEVINFSNGEVNFTRAFNESGNVQIVTRVSTADGEERIRIISNVMVLEKVGGGYVDGSYVAACIYKPEDISHIVDTVVEFDASTTRGVRVADGVVDELFPGEDMFSWFWTFYPPAEGQKEEYVNVTSNTEAYKFTATFPIPGVNSAELRVEVN